SRKNAMPSYLHPTLTPLLPTHTHIQTSHHPILPHPTPYITHLPMTRYYHPILPINTHQLIQPFITTFPQTHVLPHHAPRLLSALIIHLDKQPKTTQIRRLLINQHHPFQI
ncbi:YmdB family metallophosphoesterase, partial [Staphylococcus epidermidis]|uniref:YmdB family metallophosphoesterase n=1 Tax=Staphylococcus epidermidis TaxID=1282 RepID=UPI00164328AA